jgi:hypothetical protein
VSRRVSASLSEEECSTLQAHPDYRGSLGGLLRLLALRHLGQEPSDPYDGHRRRERDEKGRMMKAEAIGYRDLIEVPDTDGGEYEAKGVRFSWGLISQHDCTSGWRIRGHRDLGYFYSLDDARKGYNESLTAAT